MADRPAIHIICSDRARNGKTLLARLLADWLRMSGEHPFIIDLDVPGAPLAERYGEDALAADFSKVTGRVALFDTIMNDPGRDYVLEVPARDLDVFLAEADKISFFAEAGEAGLDTVFLFMVDRSLGSIRKARELAGAWPDCQLFPARNKAIGDLLNDEEASELYLDLYLKGEICLPKLSPDSIATAEFPGFSFQDFANGRIEAPTSFQHYELSDFCDTVFSQFGKLQFRLDMEGLKDMGLI
jgi:hypothetical protein